MKKHGTTLVKLPWTDYVRAIMVHFLYVLFEDAMEELTTLPQIGALREKILNVDPKFPLDCVKSIRDLSNLNISQFKTRLTDNNIQVEEKIMMGLKRSSSMTLNLLLTKRILPVAYSL